MTTLRVIRGPEPPFIGAVYVSTRSRSGRRWEVDRQSRWGWSLRPLGDDVMPAQTGNRFNGGVRSITRTTDELRDRRKWKMIVEVA